MDANIQLRFSPDKVKALHTTKERLANAGAMVAEMLDAEYAGGARPTSQDIADAILKWLRTGERGQ
jgi:hypothetical protein